jgi:amino acid transporter
MGNYTILAFGFGFILYVFSLWNKRRIAKRSNVPFQAWGQPQTLQEVDIAVVTAFLWFILIALGVIADRLVVIADRVQ